MKTTRGRKVEGRVGVVNLFSRSVYTVSRGRREETVIRSIPSPPPLFAAINDPSTIVDNDRVDSVCFLRFPSS